MPIIPRSPIKAPFSQFTERDYAEKKEVDDNDGSNPVAIIGLIVAVLTLLVAIASLRSSRFRRWVSYLSPSNLVKGDPGITVPGPAPVAITSKEDLNVIPLQEIPVPSPALTCHNNLSNAHLSTHILGPSNTGPGASPNKW